MIKIFNTLTKKKEIFKPIYKNIINIYVCGITAYDLCHVGHGRTFTIFDIIIRYFKYRGYKVNYIRNITDIEDKIIYYAYKNKENIKVLTKRIVDEMHVDMDKLNILRPNHEPYATEYIKDIIILIDKLIKKKYAYISKTGDVLFSIKSFNNYGKLSNQNLNYLRKNIEDKININLNKIKQMDFVLWKLSKLNEPSWSSPWGEGRPGWHIECTAISNKILGNNFDIHGGGSDLIFPHHENEIAQSFCIDNKSFINFWIHIGMVMLNNKKISKSTNNFISIKESLKFYDPEILRYFFISSHYRSTINYNENNIKLSYIAIKKLYMSLINTDKKSTAYGGEHFIKKFVKIMNNDFNTPEICSLLFEIANEINKLKKYNYIAANGMAATLRKLSNILGILQQDPINFLKQNKISHNLNEKIINKLIKERDNARKLKQLILADQIRNKLKIMGITLEDTSSGTVWIKNI